MVRWKGRVPTWQTHINGCTKYRIAVQKWDAAGRPEEERAALLATSKKLDAIKLYLTTGEVLDGYGIEVKPDLQLVVNIGEADQLTLAV